jgi:hypothetical protein
MDHDENHKTLLDDAKAELTDAIEDAFLSAKLFRAAGDVATAQSIAAHASALQVLLVVRVS